LSWPEKIFMATELSDIAQSVWMSTLTQRMVIQVSKYGQSTNTKMTKYIVIFGLCSLLATQWYIVYYVCFKQWAKKLFSGRHPFKSIVTFMIICSIILVLLQSMPYHHTVHVSFKIGHRHMKQVVVWRSSYIGQMLLISELKSNTLPGEAWPLTLSKLHLWHSWF